MLRIEHCEYFIEVARAGSLSKAAANLNLSQPHLSQSIRQLESVVGAPLFIRGTKGVVLTSAGETCLEHAKRLVMEAEHIKQWKKSQPEETVLKIATFNAYAPIDSFYAVTQNQPLEKHILLEVRNRDVVEMVSSGKANIGIVYIESTIEHEFAESLSALGLQFVQLSSNPMDVVLSSAHPLAIYEEASIEEIKNYPLVYEAYKNQRKALGHITLLKEKVQQHYVDEMNHFLNQFSILEMGFENQRSLLYYLSKSERAFSFGQRRFNLNNPLLKSGELVYVAVSDASFYMISGYVKSIKRQLTPIEQAFVETLKQAID